MSNYRVIMSDELSHAKKRGSKYAGGFTIINGRSNNTKAYNQDYYQKNKEKWQNSKNKISGSSKKTKKSLKDKVGDLLNGVRNKAIDSISDFMVDVSMAYLRKMLTEENLDSLNIDEILYNTVSPVADRVAEEAATKAADAAMKKVQDSAATVVQDTVKNVAKETAKQAEKEAKNTANDVANQAWDWLKKKR